jgi:hypothetical protein
MHDSVVGHCFAWSAAMKRRRHGIVVLALLVSGLTWAGCGGGAVVSDFGVSPERRTALSEAGPAEQVLRLPAETPFNIHSDHFERDQEAGGTAEGESSATADGTAVCAVRVSHGGSGSADFYLGHCLENRGEAALTVDARFDIDYVTSFARDENTRVDGAYTLKVVVNDTEGRTLKQIQVENSADMEGSISLSSKSSEEFRVRLEPQRVYNFVLAGHVEAESQPETQADVRLAIKRLELTLRSQPAPARVEAAADEG